MVGIYSIATGRLVREICLVASSPPPFFSSLHLFSVTNQLGEFKNAGKTLLAAVPCNGSSVVLVELNDDLTLSSNRS